MIRTIAAVLVTSLTFASLAYAQDQQEKKAGGGGGGQRGEGRGGPGGGGGWDAGQWRQRMMDRLKQDLQANDEQWEEIEPKIEAVQQAQREMMGGMGRRWGGGGGGRWQNNGQGNQNETSALGRAAEDLNRALEDTNTSAEQLQSKVEALRAARTEERQQLQKRQEELRSILDERQRAVLVLNGMLE